MTKRMTTIVIISGILLGMVAAVFGLLRHPAFGMTDLQAKQYITVHHDKFSLAPHAWNEPDSVAHSIAEKDHLLLLDHKIGTLIRW